MTWNPITSLQQLETIKAASAQQPVFIFKHSTSCSISRTALGRLERSWKEEEMKDVQAYYLDLLSYRDISNEIARQFNIRHESPQVLVVKNGEAVFHASHFDINYDDLRGQLKS